MPFFINDLVKVFLNDISKFSKLAVINSNNHDNGLFGKSNSWSCKMYVYNAMFGVIWYHLYNLKNMKNINGGVLLLVKLQAFGLQYY